MRPVELCYWLALMCTLFVEPLMSVLTLSGGVAHHGLECQQNQIIKSSCTVTALKLFQRQKKKREKCVELFMPPHW